MIVERREVLLPGGMGLGAAAWFRNGATISCLLRHVDDEHVAVLERLDDEPIDAVGFRAVAGLEFRPVECDPAPGLRLK